MTESSKKQLGMVVKIACLCIIMFQYVKSFSTPALADVAQAFPMIDATLIKQIEGIPSLLAIVGAFCVGIFERFMKKTTMLKIAMICTLCGAAAGLMPETEGGFYGILATRAILGFGRGMIFPMASSMIADLFTGSTRGRLMSFKTASGGLSGVVFQIVGGYLAAISWQYAFIGYLLAIPLVILCWVGIPEPDVKPASARSGEKAPMGYLVWILIVIAGCWNIFQFSIFTNMALVVREAGVGDAVISGYIMSTLTFTTAAGAILYGTVLRSRLKGFDIPISLLLTVIGFFLLCNFITVELYFVATGIFGIGFGMFNPALILQCVKLVPRQGATLALAVLAGAQNLFQFLSPNVLAFLAPLMGAGSKYTQLAGWEVAWPFGLAFIVIWVIFIIFLRAKHPDKLAGVKEPPKAEAAE